MSDIRKLFAYQAIKRQKVDETNDTVVTKVRIIAKNVSDTVSTGSASAIPSMQTHHADIDVIEHCHLHDETTVSSICSSTAVQVVVTASTSLSNIGDMTTTITATPISPMATVSCVTDSTHHLSSTANISIGNMSSLALTSQVTCTSPSDISRTVAEGPVQPMLVSYKKSKDGNRMRSFSSIWYTKFPTIEYSVSRDCVFCFVCRHFKPASAYAEPVFQSTGFRHWKKFGEKMQQHIASASHIDAVVQYSAINECKLSGSVTVQLSSHVKADIQRNRDAVASIIRAVIFCARQDIALRGHRESATVTGLSEESRSLEIKCNRGNFIELLELLKEESPDVRRKIENLPRNSTYTSKDSQNEILHAASLVTREKIVSEVNLNGGIFSLIADEARDNSCTEKMSVCIRYVHSGQVRERFLGFLDVLKLDAQSLATALIAYLDENNLSIKNCVGQSYDGASVMSGEFAGVQKFIRDSSNYPCPYVHCYAHRLNLVLVDVAKRVEFVGKIFGLFEAIYSFQSVSTLRHDVFVKSQESESRVLNVPQQSDTRWVCKFKGVTFFKNRFNCVVAALDTISKSKNGKEAAEARGLLLQFKTFDVAFVLCLFSDLLGVTNSLSVVLQTSTMDFGSCARIVEATSKTIENKRNDQYFDNIWQSAVVMANDANIEIPSSDFNLIGSKRKGNVPKHLLNDFFVTSRVEDRDTDTSIDTKTQQRRKCFAVLDNFAAELKHRFEDNNYVLQAAMAIDPKHPSFLSFELMHQFVERHAKQFAINYSQLPSQVDVAKNMFIMQTTKQVNLDLQPENIQPHAILDTLAVYSQLRQMAPAFPDLVKVFQLVLCLPVSSAGAERSFSTMKRIKSYLRASMKEQRLSDLALLSIEREISNGFMTQTSVVIDKFALMGNRRLLLNT